MEMADYEQQDIPLRERARRSVKLRRGIYLLPSIMTGAKMFPFVTYRMAFDCCASRREGRF